MHHVTGRVIPYLHSSIRIESVDVMITAPYVNDSVGDGRGGIHNASGCVIPHLRPGIRIESINVAVITPYVDDSVGDGGRRHHGTRKTR